MSGSLPPRGLYRPRNAPGQNTGVGSLSLLRGVFPTQGSNPSLPHCGQILYQLSHQGSPKTSPNKGFRRKPGQPWTPGHARSQGRGVRRPAAPESLDRTVLVPSLPGPQVGLLLLLLVGRRPTASLVGSPLRRLIVRPLPGLPRARWELLPPVRMALICAPLLAALPHSPVTPGHSPGL